MYTSLRMDIESKIRSSLCSLLLLQQPIRFLWVRAFLDKILGLFQKLNSWEIPEVAV